MTLQHPDNPNGSEGLVSEYYGLCLRADKIDLKPVLVGENWWADSRSNVVGLQDLQRALGGEVVNPSDLCPIVGDVIDGRYAGDPELTWRRVYEAL